MVICIPPRDGKQIGAIDLSSARGQALLDLIECSNSSTGGNKTSEVHWRSLLP